MDAIIGMPCFQRKLIKTMKFVSTRIAILDSTENHLTQ